MINSNQNQQKKTPKSIEYRGEVGMKTESREVWGEPLEYIIYLYKSYLR